MKSQVVLTDWNEGYLDLLVNYANNPKIAANMVDSFPSPYKIENGRMFIQFATTSETSRIKAILYEGELAGSIGLHSQHDIWRKNAELGYWLAEPLWGKGLMTEAVKQMVKWGFENMDVTRIFARPFGRNKGSQKVLEKAGLTLEARIQDGFFKNGKYEDELIYSIRR